METQLRLPTPAYLVAPTSPSRLFPAHSTMAGMAKSAKQAKAPALDSTRPRSETSSARPPRGKPRSPRQVRVSHDPERSQHSGSQFANFAYPERRTSSRTDKPLKDSILPTVSNKHYVFVYGTLKKGFANAHLLDRATLIGEFRTVTPFPLVVGGKHNSPYLLDIPKMGAKVKGEVYAVDDAILGDLDHLENVGVNYCRKVAKVSNCADRSMVADVFIYFKCNGFEELAKKTYLDDYQCRRYVPRHMRQKAEPAGVAVLSPTP